MLKTWHEFCFKIQYSAMHSIHVETLCAWKEQQESCEAGEVSESHEWLISRRVMDYHEVREYYNMFLLQTPEGQTRPEALVTPKYTGQWKKCIVSCPCIQYQCEGWQLFLFASWYYETGHMTHDDVNKQWCQLKKFASHIIRYECSWSCRVIENFIIVGKSVLTLLLLSVYSHEVWDSVV